MEKIILISGMILLLLLIYSSLYTSTEVWERKKEMVDNVSVHNLRITILYDNNEYDKRLKTAWGFSCLVELENKTLLFDTGGDPGTLLSNMKLLGIEPKNIGLVVLSHIHGDHVGGLSGFLEKNSNVTVYIPSSFPDSFRERIESAGADLVDVSGPTKISDGIYSTGELGTWIKEQSLIINTDKGLVVITGCAHPGIVNIVRKAKELLDKNVYLVLGGFHLGGASESELKSIVEEFRQLDVKKVAPCHCSGDRARALFEEEYEDDYIESGVGKIIEI